MRELLNSEKERSEQRQSLGPYDFWSQNFSSSFLTWLFVHVLWSKSRKIFISVCNLNLNFRVFVLWFLFLLSFFFFFPVKVKNRTYEHIFLTLCNCNKTIQAHIYKRALSFFPFIFLVYVMYHLLRYHNKHWTCTYNHWKISKFSEYIQRN